MDNQPNADMSRYAKIEPIKYGMPAIEPQKKGVVKVFEMLRPKNTKELPPPPSKVINETVEKVSTNFDQGKYSVITGPHEDELRYVVDVVVARKILPQGDREGTKATTPPIILRVSAPPDETMTCERALDCIVAEWNSQHEVKQVRNVSSPLSIMKQFSREIVQLAKIAENDRRKIALIIENAQNISSIERDDLLALVRELYNGRSTDPKLKAVVAIITTTEGRNSLITNKTRTPFNIGDELQL